MKYTGRKMTPEEFGEMVISASPTGEVLRLSVIVCAGLFVFLLMTTRTGFVPDEDLGTIMMDISMPPGTSLQRSDEILDLVNQRIADIPEIELRSSVAGYGMLSGTLVLIFLVPSLFCVFKFIEEKFKPEELADARMAGLSEKNIAMFWNALASVDYENVIVQIQGYARQMGLEGWSLCLLVENFARTLFGPGCENEVEVFKTFLLNQMGLDAKMGLVDGKIKTMVCVKEQVYARVFCEFEGKHYYFGPEVQNVTQLMSYSGNFSDDLMPVSAMISKPMRLGGTSTEVNIRKSSKVFETSFSLPINLAQCAFYLDFPQVDVDVYARAAYNEAFVTALTNALEPSLRGLDEIAKANALLAFLQFDFKYSTDEDQFGFEKPFFLEENFIYQANDCEDRSILFSFLVRKLLGLDVVLLDYPDHIATAVCFSKEVQGDSFLYNGQRFTVCDPTYIGAPVGMAMEDYRDIEFNVLTL